MSYSVLARKWRPATFDEVVGQEAVIQTLKNSILEGRIHHSLIFSGLRGTGKTSTARIYAKALNCKNGPTVEPCLECDACKEIAEGRDIDVMEIDAASNKGVDDIRNLKEIVKYPPIRDRYRIFIIDEVHMLSTHAFNALLKTIEEPPSYVVFILATTEPHKIPATIRSRCQIFEFKKIPAQKIIKHLSEICKKENIKIEPSALRLIVDASEGSMRDAQSLLDQIISFSGNEIKEEDVSLILGVPDSTVFFRIFEAIVEDKREEIVSIIDSLEEKNTDFVKFVLRLGEFFNSLLHAIVKGDNDFFPEWFKSGNFSVEDIIRYINIILQNERFIREAFNPRIATELLLFKMVFASKVVPISELLKKKDLNNQLNQENFNKKHPEREDINTQVSKFLYDYFKNSSSFSSILWKSEIVVKDNLEIMVKVKPIPETMKDVINKTVFPSVEENLLKRFKKRYRLMLEVDNSIEKIKSESERIASHPLVKKILDEFDGTIERIIK